MHILHTESSPGWGGQEIRILKEAQGMRARGHTVIFVVQKDGGLVAPARQAGFCVYECQFQKKRAFSIVKFIINTLRQHSIQVVNTHSSLDAWLAGLAARWCRIPVIRTRHLSTPIRTGWNSRLLYNGLADHVVTTCQEVVPRICAQAHLPHTRCSSVPTGIDTEQTQASEAAAAQFRQQWNIEPQTCLVGTVCILRGWKGVSDLLHAAKLLEHVPNLKWMVVGGGVSGEAMQRECQRLGLEGRVLFTGCLSPPYAAIRAFDIFALLSWAHEGVSQASLQAAWLERPLITTPTGGLKEICIPGKTGILVPPHSPHAVAEAVSTLLKEPTQRAAYGNAAKLQVLQTFTWEHTLDQMEQLFNHYSQR